MTSAGSIEKAVALTGGYGLPEDALELLRDEISWALDLAEARGRSDERAAVVAWLEKAGWMPSMVEVFRRGDHRREETP